jgi:3-hydroxyisobutyrate dehydrogenase-like beta-hydroxyacid dehydrogenase
MGSPMALNLLRGGSELLVYNRSAEKTRPLVAAGAVAVASPAEIGRRGARVVFSMLGEEASVEAAILGPDGLAEGLAPGSVHVSSTTLGVALSRRLAEEHRRRGQRYVAAPVLGRRDAAAAARLYLLAAGDPVALADCAPYFAQLGQRTFTLGEDPAIANLAKLVCNFMIAATIESLGEALTLAGRSGLPQRQALELLTETLFNVPLVKSYGELIAAERFSPAGFRLPLGLKDIRLALAAGEEARVALPLASLIRDHMLTALARGQEDLDWSSFVKVLQ